MLLVLPIVVPLATALLILLGPGRPALQRSVAFAGSLVHLASAIALFARVNHAGFVVVQIGGWPAPFGITVVADLFSAMLVVATGVVGTAVTASAFGGVDPRRESFGYHALLQLLLMGVSGAFLTGDLFNLYVWFEVMLVASFVLMALNRTSEQVAAAFKYVTMNLLASALFLTALGLLYGGAGTLNMADLASIWPGRVSPTLDLVLATLFLVAFGIKSALFPLFFWLPGSYHAPPAAVGAAFAGLLTKVGVYALIRVFTLLFAHTASPAFTLMLGMSAATMVVGLVAALSQRDFRRVLSFNLVAHIGYTTAALSLLTPGALAGSILYILHHIVVITNLFLVSGVLLRLRRTTGLDGLGSLYRETPAFAAIALVPMFSLAGVPPLSGFLGKLAIVQGAFDAGAYWLGGLVLIVGLLTLLSMSRLWSDTFWKEADGGTRRPSVGPGRALLAPIAAMSLLTLAITVWAGPLYSVVTRAADQLLRPDAYVHAVLGHGR